jgi:hypothetical protein
MKSTLLKFLSSRPILIGLIMAGFYFVSPASMQAQSVLNSNYYLVPDGPYVAPTVAIERLEDQLVSLKNQLNFYNSSSQEYRIVSAKFNFFSTIHQSLVEGKTVKVSIQDGVNAFGSSDLSSGLPKGKKEEFKIEVINLLKL